MSTVKRWAPHAQMGRNEVGGFVAHDEYLQLSDARDKAVAENKKLRTLLRKAHEALTMSSYDEEDPRLVLIDQMDGALRARLGRHCNEGIRCHVGVHCHCTCEKCENASE